MLRNLHSGPPVSRSPILAQRGFSMLEILITLVIVATALFGTAGLQIYAMRMGMSGQSRTQAVFLASDIAERMEANKLGATTSKYELPLTDAKNTPTTDCYNSPCSQDALASWDLIEWGNTIFDLMPGASWQITPQAPCVLNSPCTYQIVINWTDRRTNTEYATSVSGVGETLSYTATRTIF